MSASRKVGVTLGELLGRDAGEFLDLLAEHLGATPLGDDNVSGRLAYSMAEGAEALGCARSTVYEMARRGDLSTSLLAGRRFIPRAELLRVLAARETDGIGEAS